MAEFLVDSPYFKGSTEARCMSKPIYDLILGKIPAVREPNNPDINWDTGNLENERVFYNNKEISWRQDSTISTTHDKTVTKDDNDNIRTEPSDNIQEKVILELPKQSKADVIGKGHALQTRTQKLKKGKTFQKVNVMKGLGVHSSGFIEEHNKEGTVKWVRERAKSKEKKTRKDMVQVSWFV